MLSAVVWDIDPILIHIGDGGVRWYGLLWAIGIYLAYLIQVKLYKNENCPADWTDKLFMWMVIGLIIGARVGHCWFYEWHDVTLPAKFKIAVGGCPNNCIKPSLNDFGISGWTRVNEAGERVPGYKITLGGLWGKSQRVGTPVEGVFSKEQVLSILEQVLKLWMEEAEPKERFGRYLDRVGADAFIARLQF